MGVASANTNMDEDELELKARRDSLVRFEDQSGRDGADGSLILADALTYAAGATAFITAILDAMEDGGLTVRTGVLIGAGFGLWICSQSLNNFRRLLPVWLRVVLGMRVLPETFEDAKSRPEALNLLSIFAALNNEPTKKIISQYAGKDFSLFKKDLIELTIEKITPINKEIEKLNQNPQYLDTIINKGKDKAISIADSVLNRVYTAVGLKNNQYPQ